MNKSQEESHIEYIRHSLAHVLAMAVLKKFPKVGLGIGRGFFLGAELEYADEVTLKQALMNRK